VSRPAATPENESTAPGTIFMAPDLPVEPAGVPVDVVLDAVVVAPVGLLVEDCCVAAGAIYK
jgi:hypothetical protein